MIVSPKQHYQKVINRNLTYLCKTFDPVDNLPQVANLHKVITRCLVYDNLHIVAIEACLQVFIPIIHRTLLPDWVDLLERLIELAQKKPFPNYLGELLVHRCTYLYESESLVELGIAGEKALAEPYLIHDKLSQAEILRLLGAMHHKQRTFDRARIKANKSLSLVPSPKTKKECGVYGRIFNLLGTIWGTSGNLEQAQSCFETAKLWLKESDDLYYYHWAQANSAYYSTGNTSELISAGLTLQSTIQFFSTQNYKLAKNHALNNLAQIYVWNKELTHAEKTLLDMDVDYLYQIPRTFVLVWHHTNLGYVYKKQGAYQLAKQHLRSAEDIQEEMSVKNLMSQANTLALLGTVCKELGEHEECVRAIRASYALAKPLSQAEDSKAQTLLNELLDEFPDLLP